MGGIAYVPKAEEEAHRKIIGRIFDWFSQQDPEPFEVADFQAICIDAGLMTDCHDFTPLGRAVFGMKQTWENPESSAACPSNTN